MLGVQRTTALAIAGRVKAQGLIAYRYGKVEIRDRAGTAYNCYAVFRGQVDDMAAAVAGAAQAPDPARP